MRNNDKCMTFNEKKKKEHFARKCLLGMEKVKLLHMNSFPKAAFNYSIQFDEHADGINLNANDGCMND